MSPKVRVQLRPEFLKIVDLAIEHDSIPAAFGEHGLVAFGREIQDREAPMAEGDAGIPVYPEAVVVGAAVAKSLRHSDDGVVEVVGARAIQI